MRKNILWSLIFALTFFVIGLITLPNYGINWDEAIHYLRGQGYLHYYLSGQTTYDDLKADQPARLSYYQTSSGEAKNFLHDDSGHPPLNGILASFFNFVFYQKLGWLGDIEAYHLFVLFVSTLLVLAVMLLVVEEYGLFAGILAGLSLVLFPLFFSESHFNIKDPVEASFFALTIYTFYQGIKRENWQWILASSIFCGLALGTKFNILFVSFIIFPWLFISYGKKIGKLKRFLPIFLLYSLIAFFIFFASWPYLWGDPFVRILETFRYYKGIGISAGITQPANFYIFGFNTYPLQTILFTTPLVILFFSLWGVIYSFRYGFKEKNKTSLLVLLWFLVPILRVSVPGTSIYGGVRQIMEYIPAMAILSGIGAKYLISFTRMILPEVEPLRGSTSKKFLQTAVILSFLPITLKLISIHPNENVYFNPLIGGLSGAKEKNYPYWGLNLGSSFKQGVEWLNGNVEKGARVALVVSTGGNVPRIYFREDIQFDNGFWSDRERKGEYLVEAVYRGWIREWYYAGEYADRILKPVYEVKVDSVPILKVWKNDQEHTYPEFLKDKAMTPEKISWKKEKDIIVIKLSEVVKLMEIAVDYSMGDCSPFEAGRVSLSLDGENWSLQEQPIRKVEKMIEEGKIIYPLVAKEAKHIKILPNPESSCDFEIKGVNIRYI